MKRFEYKVPGGKLLRVKLEERNGVITFLQLTGDFFMIPETDLEGIESKLIGFKCDPPGIERLVQSYFSEKKTTMAGVSPSDISYVICQALKA